ncbi:hypothetical protein GCM10010123_35300 [Pilimelia anulata]|uniref:histidine kinase n=1 Tax=Pilimelia anulata TaxID=53371 RepID=A0A8J3FBM6_9ACTN|nr:PAS domain-containing sensor histidine kinase [Pilimelia anulata]GGK02263.1 hypothetical protein GCM10010123_35300 [Pilimelia anulata]
MTEPRGVTATAVAQQPDAAGRGLPRDAARGWARLAALATGAPLAAVWLAAGDHLAVRDRWAARARPDDDVLDSALPYVELVRDTGEPYELRDTRAAAPGDVHAFLGVDIPDPDGRPVGVVAALDLHPRAWQPADYTTLRDIAGMVSAARTPDLGRRAPLLLSGLLESVENIMIISCNADGTIELADEALRALPGMPASVRADADHVLPWLCDAAGHPLRVGDTPLARAYGGERVRDARVLYRPPSGTARTWSINGLPLRHADGRPAGAIVAVHDVTDARRRRRLREAELAVARAVAVPGAAPDRVYAAILAALGAALDATGAELWLDDAVGGRTRRAARWPAPADGQPPADPAGAAEVTPVALGGHRFGSLRTRGARADGARELLDSVAEQVAHYLEQRRAAALAEELSRTRDEFIALAGHALRTPLTAIASLAELLREGDADLADQRIALLGRIESNAATLRGIVEDLLDLAGLESGHISLIWAPVDLAELVERRLAERAPADGRVRLRGELPEHLPLTGDRMRLGQVVDNLLSNAVKYSPEGGEVRVRLHRHDDIAELTVADEGLGVPAAERDKLFHRFFRGATAHERGIPGTGLGLALTRVIVERHGGSIALADDAARGAEFVVRLPLNPPQ